MIYLQKKIITLNYVFTLGSLTFPFIWYIVFYRFTNVF